MHPWFPRATVPSSGSRPPVQSSRLGLHQQQGQPGQRRIIQHQVRLPVLKPAGRGRGRHRVHRPESRQQRRWARWRDRIPGTHRRASESSSTTGTTAGSTGSATTTPASTSTATSTPWSGSHWPPSTSTTPRPSTTPGSTTTARPTPWRCASPTRTPGRRLRSSPTPLTSPLSWAGTARRLTTPSSGSPRAPGPRQPTTTSSHGSSATATGPSARTARPSSTPAAPTPARKARRWASPAPPRTT